MNHTGIQFYDLHTREDHFATEILAGLRRQPRSIPPKYFYDERGSKLFDAITRTTEYYPTRTEVLILQQYAGEIAKRLGTGSLLIEPGGGSCSKVRILLEDLQPCVYVPMDISRDHLRLAAEKMSVDYPWLEVHAACADFTRTVALPDEMPAGRRVAFFPGSSIGNFHPIGAQRFLANIAQLVGSDGSLLIGVDLKKDKKVLEAAYNDSQGMTAAFNLNLLEHVNRVLGANFNLSNWRHLAFYNEKHGRIEMHLQSKKIQTVTIEAESFEFDRDETIHTENSYKYSIEEFASLARRSGFVVDCVWTDAEQLFSVHLLKVQ